MQAILDFLAQSYDVILAVGLPIAAFLFRFIKNAKVIAALAYIPGAVILLGNILVKAGELLKALILPQLPPPAPAPVVPLNPPPAA